MRGLAAAAIISALFATGAHAQVIPGDSPNMGVGAAVRSSPGLFNRHAVENPWREADRAEGERQHQEALKRIPNRKTSKDPWRNMRQATPTAIDRTRPE